MAFVAAAATSGDVQVEGKPQFDAVGSVGGRGQIERVPKVGTNGHVLGGNAG